MVVIVEEFSADQLIYRGEGNSSLVVAIKSTSQVIRLLKSDAKKLRNANDVLTHLLQHIDFNENVLPFVFPAHLFVSPRLICLDGQQMDLIKSFIKDKRPSFRLDKTLSKGGYALLMADFCSLPKTIAYDWTGDSVIAIEIKPKQGFLPDQSLFATETDDILQIKSRICRFGLSQFYKLQKKSIKSISTYCPLDLFSGCPSRTLYAIRCLIDNPQNNFRVFLNSHLIYGDRHHSTGENQGKFNQENLIAILGEFFRSGHGSAGGRGQKHFKSNHTKCSPSIDPIVSFGRLLFQVLCTPLDSGNDGKNFPEILQKGNRHDYKYVPNVKRELEKLDEIENYAFFSTFIELFEKFTLNGIDRPPSLMNLISNKNGNEFIDEANKENLEEKDTWISQPSSSCTECLLHRFSNISNPDFKCHCNDGLSGKPVSHILPSGSVLDSILRAQKLDTIDSLMAVQILDRLYGKYRDMKLTSDPKDSNQFRKFLEKFILQNIHDLDTLWHFLLSLTAKDCSIMIAMARNPAVDFKQFYSMSTIDVIDKITDYRYIAKVSIIDLDYKSACKIQRTLHNDRRMINAFLMNKNSVTDSDVPTEEPKL